MKHVVVDLEMNAIDRKYYQERQYCKMEIIQIGAIVLDEEYKEIGSFSTLVKPQYNSIIESAYQQLTGISTYMVKNAPIFVDALNAFFDWIKGLNDEISVYAWSENDLDQIYNESYLKEYEFSEYEENIIQNWYDFQEEFEEKLNFNYQVSLADALYQVGISFEGQQHNALYDAKNTAHLLSLIRNDDQLDKTFRKIMEKQEVVHPTLGDLFDFSQLDFD